MHLQLLHELADLSRGLVPSQGILLIRVAQEVFVQLCSCFSLEIDDLGRYMVDVYFGVIFSEISNLHLYTSVV